ncbi:MAG: biotin-dependent carboxyltransferase family protein [Gemmataceae bacterium]|nr:biotin-dependent carboxyltransferase family protein [Gemmataceae bacterium]
MSASESPPLHPPLGKGGSGFTVVEPGWATRLVDGGRPATRSLGVPVGGAADRASWMLGNAQVGNPPDAPALEIAVKGPTLRADCEIGCVVFGAPFVLSSARQALASGRTFTLATGEELHIGGAPAGLRAYLCVAGGFDAPVILGSRSALEPVARGAVLACSPSRLKPRFVGPERPLLNAAGVGTLRVLPGQQADWFQAAEFYGQTFTVSPASNRMGLRLQGAPLTMPIREMVSEPVCPGSVQVTRDGQCIILGIDGQTIGGYPKIAQVIRADLDALGQLRPGDPVSFVQVDLPTAVGLDRQRRELLHEWITRLRVSLQGTTPPSSPGSANRR